MWPPRSALCPPNVLFLPCRWGTLYSLDHSDENMSMMFPTALGIPACSRSGLLELYKEDFWTLTLSQKGVECSWQGKKQFYYNKNRIVWSREESFPTVQYAGEVQLGSHTSEYCVSPAPRLCFCSGGIFVSAELVQENQRWVRHCFF